MTPYGKIVVGLVVTLVVAAAAHGLARGPLLSNLGDRSTRAMADAGVKDGRTNWVSDAGWTSRVARISGTADAATRVRTLAAVSALPGIHDAIWIETPGPAAAARNRPVDCRQRVTTILAAHPIEFSGNGSGLAPGADAVIDSVANAVRTCPAARFEVIGHVAPTSNPLFGLALSQARAEAVVDALARRGIDMRSLEPIGLGTTQFDLKDRIEVRIRRTGAAKDVAQAPS